MFILLFQRVVFFIILILYFLLYVFIIQYNRIITIGRAKEDLIKKYNKNKIIQNTYISK